MLLLQLAIAPVAFLLIYIYKRDVISKEPTKALIKAFIGGVLSPLIVFAMIWPFQAMFGDAASWEGLVWSAFGQAFFEAGVPEEIAKFIILYFLVWKSKDFDEHFDGIIYAVFVGMGFACIENVLYVFESGATTALVRAVTAVPMHFFAAVIMGYFFSRAKFFQKQRKTYLRKAITLPIILHSVYDFILFLAAGMASVEEDDLDYYIIPLLLLIVFFFFFNFKLWKRGKQRIEELRADDIAVQNGSLRAPVNDAVK